MVFSSHIFLFYFLPFVLLIYFAMVGLRLNLSWINLFITVASYVFYGWFEPWFVVLMMVSTIVDYACGKAIAYPQRLTRPGEIGVGDWLKELKSVNLFYPLLALFGSLFAGVFNDQTKRDTWMRNTALAISMLVNLGLLGYFKYYMFFLDGMNRLAQIFGAETPMFQVMQVVLPIGISFYTFQTMSYTIDVWRGDAPPVKDMRTFSCFVALFPQLVAGPIIRYNTVAEQLRERTHSLELFSSGAAIFILGLGKKILLADQAAVVADAVFGADSPDVVTAWWGILGYSFQIYFDFCAYSDMAVGLGRMMGFEFIKNFDAPYHAHSISNFWNRWHISLSTWIRDYLYIGLGGNRKGVKRTYFNLAIAFFLSGLWHGAQWTFIAWGTFHGLLLVWERTMGRKAIYNFLPSLPKVVITNALILFTWVLFRSPSMDQAMRYWGSMVGMVEPVASAALLRANVFSVRHVTEMLICAVFIWQPIQAHEWVKKLTPGRMILISIVLILSLIQMFTSAFSPFLYFQF